MKLIDILRVTSNGTRLKIYKTDLLLGKYLLIAKGDPERIELLLDDKYKSAFVQFMHVMHAKDGVYLNVTI